MRKVRIPFGHGTLDVPIGYLREGGKKAVSYICVNLRIEVQIGD